MSIPNFSPDPRVDASDLQSAFASQLEADAGAPEIVNFRTLALAVMLRSHRELAASGRAAEGTRSPCDYVVFVPGSPALPGASRIGGIPHMSRRAAWPCARDGAPMRFVGQLSLRGSMDVFAGCSIQGDMLLFFASDSVARPRTVVGLECVALWGDTSCATTYAKDDVPIEAREAAAAARCFGVKCRLFDSIPGSNQGEEPDSLYCLKGTKIGGVTERWLAYQRSIGSGYKFLASLGGIYFGHRDWVLAVGQPGRIIVLINDQGTLTCVLEE